jgi:hypothetical protein
VIRNILLGLSGAAVGTAGFITYERVRQAFRSDLWQLFYALASAGFAGAVFLIAKAVLKPAPRIALTADAVWYAVSLAAASTGYLGIALDQRRRNRRQDDDRQGIPTNQRRRDRRVDDRERGS